MSSIMISTLLLLLFLLCHAMYGCDGRLLGIGKESRKHFHHSSKDVEKAIMDDISKVKPCLVKEINPKRKHRKATSSSKNGRLVVNDKSVGNGARTTDHQEQIKHPEALLKEDQERKQMIQGSEVKIISDMGLQQSTKIKGSERRGRSILGSPQSLVKDETIDHSDPKENGIGVVEDVVVMDYAQPHKKPPIHNFSP